MAPSHDQGDLTIENVISEVGFGKYQLVCYFFICLAALYTNMATLSFIFTARDSTYRCFVPDCDSDPSVYDQQWLPNAIPYENDVLQKCEHFSQQNVTTSETLILGNQKTNTCDTIVFDNVTKVQCKRWVYGEGQTIVKEFEIPCEKWKLSLIGTVNGIGQLVSLSVTGILSDKYGRRNLMAILTVMAGVMGIIQSFSTNFVFFIVCEFLCMVAVRGANTTAFILAIEILSTKYRVFGCTLLEITDSTANVIFGLIAWAVPFWRSLLRIISVPALLVVISIFVIPESILWLNVKGKSAETKAALKLAAKWNNKNLSQQSIIKLDQITLEVQSTLDHKENVNFFAMFKSRKMTIRIVACSLCWFGLVMLYYGLFLNVINIGHNLNVYLIFIYVSLVEYISIVIYTIILKYFPRKWSTFICLLLTGFFCIVYVFVPNYSILPLFMYLLCKIFTSASFKLMYVYTAEMFPTDLRNSSICLCSLLARIGGSLASQVTLLAVYHPGLPMATFGVVAGISAFTVLFMPETKGKNLPDTIQEAEEL